MKHTRQRTDIIHGTIYLSEFETELSSTPFFYRLHDIYQSSTVYLTFPSNRTKRYEHSLGTMALASEMLFAGLTNAAPKVRSAFFAQLNDEFRQLYRRIFKKDYSHSYLGDCRSIIIDLVAQSKYGTDVDSLGLTKLEQNVDKHINQVLSKNLLSDHALNHFSLHGTKNGLYATSKEQSIYEVSETRERLIYQCVLQAVRIVALFHDIGHPPYSHIIEGMLKDLYMEYKSPGSELHKNIDYDKSVKLEESLGRFLNTQNSGVEQNNPLEFEFLTLKKAAPSPHLHEQVGIHMFRLAIESVIPGILHTVAAKTWTAPEKLIVALYYLSAVEFAASILLEKNNFFLSMHRIIDGTIDADRLDYVTRDSHNSGVNWGEIPYKRLIDSAKLVCLDQKGKVTKDCTPQKDNLYVIAYPQKISSDIEDFLLNRHKIFARINYHHRCTKTAAALQSAVRILSKDFLTCPTNAPQPIEDSGLRCVEDEILDLLDPEDQVKVKMCEPTCVSDSIEILWTALGSTNGDEALKVLQWNDSWMVSTLQSALLRIRTEENFSEKVLLQTVRNAWTCRFSETAPEAELSTEGKKAILHGVIEKKQSELNELQRNLEEFLLNKKVYYSLFKRGIDIQLFVNNILKCAGLSLESIEAQTKQEKYSYVAGSREGTTSSSPEMCMDDEKGRVLETSRRLKEFLLAATIGDLGNIIIIIPEKHLKTEDIIRNTLEEAKNDGIIADFKLYPNPGWGKTGLPDNDKDFTKRIYLYDGDSGREYDTSLTLRPQIKAIQHDMLWLYIYIMPPEGGTDTDQLLVTLRGRCASAIAKRIRQRFDELFPSHS